LYANIATSSVEASHEIFKLVEDAVAVTTTPVGVEGGVVSAAKEKDGKREKMKTKTKKPQIFLNIILYIFNNFDTDLNDTYIVPFFLYIKKIGGVNLRFVEN
jgi:hypothetical protein